MVDKFVKFGSTRDKLGPAPIRPSWILEGNPVARNRFLTKSADGAASTYIWDCTAGRFKWHYDIDETVTVVEGSVVVKDQNGDSHKLVAGDTAFFPAGCRAEWTVENYIRKVAILRVPMPKTLLIAKRVYHAFKRFFGGGNKANDAAPAMFQSN